MENIYAIGHKVPDLDSVSSAYAYCYLKRALGFKNYIPAVCQMVNPVTLWAFEYFGAKLPEVINSVAGKKIILLDHNEEGQRPNGWEKSDILEIIDHHNLSDSKRISGRITILPYGSCSAIIGEMLLVSEVLLDRAVCGVILAGIMDDTLALTSPNTKKADKLVAYEVAEVAGVKDLSAFCRQLCAKKDVWSIADIKNLVESDAKGYKFKNVKLRISQVETMDNRNLSGKEREVIKYLGNEAKSKGLDINIVMITDVIRGDAILLFAGRRSKDLLSIFNSNLANGSILYLPGVVSRKSQIVPYLKRYYDGV